MVGPHAAAAQPDDDELVVLLDAQGAPVGTAPKHSVHGATTPYHLAFSCYAFGPDDRLLLTRRSLAKRTFPGVWTNSCCGHPAPSEVVEAAVRRRLAYELGLVPTRLELALPDFSYRASAGGVEEHELCPVYLARVPAGLTPRPDEVAEVGWLDWTDLPARSLRDDYSPWSRLQVPELASAVPDFLAG